MNTFKDSIFNVAVGTEYYVANLIMGALFGGVTGGVVGHVVERPKSLVQYQVQPDNAVALMTISQYDLTPFPDGTRVLIQLKNNQLLLIRSQ